jgi:hypothetical protein
VIIKGISSDEVEMRIFTRRCFCHLLTKINTYTFFGKSAFKETLRRSQSLKPAVLEYEIA